MSTAERFAPLDEQHAPAAARALLSASRAKFGFIPSPVAKAAHSPILLKHMLGLLSACESTNLPRLDREVIAMTVAFENDCDYCMALHSAALAKEASAEALLAQLRSGSDLSNARLETLRRFVLAVLRHGRPQESSWAAMSRAGYSEEQCLEVLLMVAAYWLSTRANVLSDATLDAPFEPYRWSRPQERG